MQWPEVASDGVSDGGVTDSSSLRPLQRGEEVLLRRGVGK